MPLDPHAVESPIDWIEWGPLAFERARREEKPILLRISAMWCHWCHVMDETTDADPEVARRANDWFIPVRVDNDERPDINDRYNLGGWPTTAFLTPEGELITGGTYFPATQFRQVLERVHTAWQGDRETIDREVRRIRERRHAAVEETGRGRFDAGAVTATIESILDAYDWRFGGFGTAPKFPQPEAVRLLLHAHVGSGADAPRQAAVHTLDAMRNAGVEANRAYGLYDHEAGGFFRYSTTRDWREPHFEKMAEDNARLGLAYLDGYRVTGDERYADTVRGIFGYVLATLSDRLGGIYGSQDADGEADYYGRSLAERAALPTPVIDRRLYTSWNGMAIATALAAANVLDWPDLEAWALRSLDRIDAALATEGGGIRHVLRPPYDASGVDREAPLLLTDHAWWLQACLAAFQTTGGIAFRDRAIALATAIERDFFDAARGACRDRRSDTAGEAILDTPHYPVLDNAAAASGLARLSALGGADRWRERAGSLVDGVAGEAARLGFLGAGLALSAVEVLGDPVRVHVVGSATDPETRAMVRTAWRWYRPERVIEIIDAEACPQRAAELGYPPGSAVRAFVCPGDRCLEPADSVEALKSRLASVA